MCLTPHTMVISRYCSPRRLTQHVLDIHLMSIFHVNIAWDPLVSTSLYLQPAQWRTHGHPTESCYKSRTKTSFSPLSQQIWTQVSLYSEHQTFLSATTNCLFYTIMNTHFFVGQPSNSFVIHFFYHSTKWRVIQRCLSQNSLLFFLFSSLAFPYKNLQVPIALSDIPKAIVMTSFRRFEFFSLSV